MQIEEPDQAIEAVEPFQCKSGSNSFGTKVACHFEGWIRVFLTLLFDPNLKVISQGDNKKRVLV
jgi:hypothetical protein